MILRLLDDVVDKAVFAELKKRPPSCFSREDLRWLDEAIQKAKGCVQPGILQLLVERLPRSYRFIRAFHGCRPVSHLSYLERGLCPSDPDALNEIAMNVFTNKAGVAEAIQDLARIEAEESYTNYNKGKVFFFIEKEYLVEHCDFFWRYGSEYLHGIADRIGELAVLRRAGRANVIECNVPISDMCVEDLMSFAGQILGDILEKYLVRPYRPETYHGGFCIQVAVKPENIVAFHYPEGDLQPTHS